MRPCESDSGSSGAERQREKDESDQRAEHSLFSRKSSRLSDPTSARSGSIEAPTCSSESEFPRRPEAFRARAGTTRRYGLLRHAGLARQLQVPALARKEASSRLAPRTHAIVPCRAKPESRSCCDATPPAHCPSGHSDAVRIQKQCGSRIIAAPADQSHAAGSDAAAIHPAGNKNDREETSRHGSAATLLPSGLPSTPATPGCLLTKPSVQGEAAVGEELRRALHRGDFVHQFAREEDDLILLRHNRLIAALR